jgi:hypothetical protein
MANRFMDPGVTLTSPDLSPSASYRYPPRSTSFSAQHRVAAQRVELPLSCIHTINNSSRVVMIAPRFAEPLHGGTIVRC